MSVTTMPHIRAVFLVGIREFSRDFGTIFLNLVFPAMFVFFLFLSTLSASGFKYKVGIVEEQPGASSMAFVQAVAATPNVALTSVRPGFGESALKNGDVDTVLVLPAAYPAAEVRVLVGHRFEGLARLLLDASRDRVAQAAHEQRPFTYTVHDPGVAVQSDLVYTFPGLLALAMIQLGLFGTAVPLLQARDRGTLVYMSLTPLTPLEMLLGQVTLRLVVAMVQVVIILVAGSFLVALSPLQWLQVLLVSVLGVMLMVSFGYIIAGMATSPQAGTALILVSNFALMLGGNVFIDPAGSSWRMAVATVMPISYLADLFRHVVTREHGLWSVWTDISVIVAVSVAFAFIAARTFRFDTQPRHQSGRPGLVGRLLRP